MLRDPHGGVEDVQAMKDAGMDWISLNVADHAPATWDLVRSRAAAAGVEAIPKARIGVPGSGVTRQTCLDHLVAISRTAMAWNPETRRAVVNVETELKTLITPADVAAILGTYGVEAAISTESWLYDSMDWTPLRAYPVFLQIYPEDNHLPILTDPVAMAASVAAFQAFAVSRARDKGFVYVGTTFQAWRSDPTWFDRSGTAWSLAFGDDVVATGGWNAWSA